VHARLAEKEASARDAAMLAPPQPSLRTAAEGLVEPASESAEDRLARWRASLAAGPGDWRQALKLFKELAALPPDEALEILTELWPELSDTQKEQALRAFTDHGHPKILAILHLGATDAIPGVQSRALQYLRDYSYQSFAEDYDAYLRWAAIWRDRPLADVLTENTRAFLQELSMLSFAELAERLADFERLDLRTSAGLDLDLAQVFRESGALEVLAKWLECPEFRDGNFVLGEVALSWAASLDADEAWLRAHVLPRTEHWDEGVANGALYALGNSQNSWAVPELIALLARTPSESSAITVGARALAEIGDPTAIPAMIGMIAANPCYDTIYGIGYFGLGKLTGVFYDESHDGDWWIAWWEQNKGRFPPEVAALPIPKY
jgi:HEAT repeat protein